MGDFFFQEQGPPQRAPLEGYLDNPNDVNALLLESSLSINYKQMRNLAHRDGLDEHTYPAMNEIDYLPSKELFNLPLLERNAITEEIHGVVNLAPVENPRMINSGLRQFNACIEELPVGMKSAYLRAQVMYPDTYINSPEWRLRFLRCDFFDAQKAAIRMVNFLDILSDIFGDYVLKRPVQMTDFCWEEMQAFRRGHYQLLPYRDRSGRRIFTVVGGFDTKTPLAIRVKIMLYLLLAASEEVETQRKGITSIVIPGIKFSAEKESHTVKLDRLIFLKRVCEYLPVRSCSIHMCLPNIPYVHVFRTSVIVFLHSHRKRMKFHTGEPVEIKYCLQGYGIPVELIPLTDTGNVKTVYLKQWMKVRKVIDAMNVESIRFSVPAIECPGSHDVIFRSGTSISCHPGNARFRGLMEGQLASLIRSKALGGKVTHSELADQLISEITKVGGRFLKWDTKGGYWTEICDPIQIHTKIVLSIRDFKYKTRMQRANQQSNHSHTFMFCQNSKYIKSKGKRCLEPVEFTDQEGPAKMMISSDDES